MMTSSTRNVSGLLTRTASAHPARTAIVFGGERISYAELDAASNRVANLLIERGIRPGGKVALSCPNIPQFTTIYFGILKAGAVVVPLNVLLKAREIAYHLNDSDAIAYFAFEGSSALPIGHEAWSGFQAADRATQFFLIGGGASVDGVTSDQLYAAAVAGQPETFETVERADDDTAVILYTSGTTGQPKGAERALRDVAGRVFRQVRRGVPGRIDRPAHRGDSDEAHQR
jgi:long-chain acyl-CoA synthetase